MKRSAKEDLQKNPSAISDKNLSNFTTKEKDDKEDMFSKEEQDNYEESDIKSNPIHTSGPES